MEWTLPEQPSINDVIMVTLSLNQYLPIELVDLILDEANYWAQITTTKWKLVRVGSQIAAAEDSIESGDHLYLRTPPLPWPEYGVAEGGDDVSGGIRVKKVVFRFRSGCAIWRSQQGGLADKSYSWLEASIEKPDEDLEIPNTPPFRFTPARRWHLRFNHASDRIKRHEIIWTDHANNPGSVTKLSPKDDIEGDDGQGRDFVRSLKAGSSILIYARAKVPDWETCVYNAEVEVYYNVS